MMRDVVGYTGELTFDQSKPDGMLAKFLDSSCLARMGWKPRTSIRTALMLKYEWFLKHCCDAKGKADDREIL